MVNFLKQLVSLESSTTDKKAVDTCSDFVAKEFRKIGCKTTSLAQKEIGDHHIFEFKPGRLKDASDEILVLTHIDTVWPVGKIDKMPFYISGNKAYGPGVLDMKAGLVMVYYALATIRHLNLAPQKKITVFVNSAEEVGHASANEIIRKLARKSSLVLCLEPALPGGALKLERKGRLVVRVEVSGKAAHSGTPEKGVSAIEELLSQLQRIKKLGTGETTVNLGLVGGGEKANIVAGSAWAVFDIRFWRARDRERIVGILKELKPILKGARVKYTVQSSTPPMEKTKATGHLFDRAAEIAATLKMSLKAGKAGGGSDASLAAGMGIATLDGLGPEGDDIHAEREHVLLSSLVERTALLTELLLKL